MPVGFSGATVHREEHSPQNKASVEHRQIETKRMMRHYMCIKDKTDNRCVPEFWLSVHIYYRVLGYIPDGNLGLFRYWSGGSGLQQSTFGKYPWLQPLFWKYYTQLDIATARHKVDGPGMHMTVVPSSCQTEEYVTISARRCTQTTTV